MRQFLKHRFFAKRLLSLLVIGCMLMSFLSGCAGGERLEPTALSFSQVEYERPDGQAVLDLIEQAQEKAQNDWLPFGLIFSLRQISKATQDFYSMMTIAQIRNYADMSDRFYSEEMDYLNTWDARIQNSYSELFTMIEQSRFGSLTGDIFGESASEDLQMNASASSADILSLQEQEKQLEAQYYEEYANATVTTPEGEVLYSELEPEGQEAYYSQFIEKYNQQLGELYLQLVELRQQMRSFWGMKATPRWPTSICCGWATPARTSGSSGRSSSRRLRRSTAPTSRTFTAVPKTARSRAWSICWGTRRPARREAGSRPCRVWRRSTTGCRSRRRGNCRCRPATAIPICSPTR